LTTLEKGQFWIQIKRKPGDQGTCYRARCKVKISFINDTNGNYGIWRRRKWFSPRRGV